MKVLSSLKSAKNRPGCKIVRRHGVVYVISKTNPRFKARQGGKRKVNPNKKRAVNFRSFFHLGIKVYK